MSCALYWKPPGKGKPVGDGQLRDAVAAEFGVPAIIDTAAIPFLRGLRAAGVQGADRLIAEIERHGSIEVWKEC